MNAAVDSRTAPVTATWICLGIAWLLFLLPVPGAAMFVGWPLNLVAFILSIVVITRGRTVAGLIPLLSSIIASPVIYLIGLAILASMIAAPSYQGYQERAGAAAQLQQSPAMQAPDAAAEADAAAAAAAAEGPAPAQADSAQTPAPTR